MFGPYQEEKQLALPSREAMEPNQGGIIQGKDGNWYFLTHHGTGDWSGRIVSLLPVVWENEWPIIGKSKHGIGSMVWSGKLPSKDGDKFKIQRSDNFNSSILNSQWQWNYQPRSEMYSLTDRPGWMRLKAFRPLKPNQLLKAGNTLTQRCFRKEKNEVVVKMDISKMANGQRSGLCHFHRNMELLEYLKKEIFTFLNFGKMTKLKESEKLGRNIYGSNPIGD